MRIILKHYILKSQKNEYGRMITTGELSIISLQQHV